MSMILRLLFSMKGRIGRLDFWMGFVILICSWVLTQVIYEQKIKGMGSLLQFINRPDVFFHTMRVLVATIAIHILQIWITFVLLLKRLHDLGRSGWFLLIGFIPVLGQLFFIYTAFFPGNLEANHYGPPPA